MPDSSVADFRARSKTTPVTAVLDACTKLQCVAYEAEWVTNMFPELNAAIDRSFIPETIIALTRTYVSFYECAAKTPDDYGTRSRKKKITDLVIAPLAMQFFTQILKRRSQIPETNVLFLADRFSVVLIYESVRYVQTGTCDTGLVRVLLRLMQLWKNTYSNHPEITSAMRTCTSRFFYDTHHRA